MYGRRLGMRIREFEVNIVYRRGISGMFELVLIGTIIVFTVRASKIAIFSLVSLKFS